MSVQYCHHCDKQVDIDWNAEHFDSSGECIEMNVELMENENASADEIEEYINNG